MLVPANGTQTLRPWPLAQMQLQNAGRAYGRKGMCLVVGTLLERAHYARHAKSCLLNVCTKPVVLEAQQSRDREGAGFVMRDA